MTVVAREPATCIDLLAAMVRFDTVNAALCGRAHPERPLADYLHRVCLDMGLQPACLPIDGQDVNLLITHRVSPDAPWLLFESHLDTVGVEGMTIEPFAAAVRDGRMFGRGACDTKSSGAAMLWALRQYVAQSQQPNNIAVLFVTDEEHRKAGITAFMKRQLPTLDWRPAGVIVGEPTLNQPVVAHNGCVRWVIATHGLAAHSSNPANGRSAIRMMAQVLLEIEDRYCRTLTASHPMTGQAQCSINMIRGGTAVNIIPDRCEVEVDRRLVPGERAAEVLPAVQAILDDMRRRDPLLQVEQLPPFIDPPLDPAGNAAFTDHVCAVMRAGGFDAQPQGVKFGTDAPTLADEGLPTIVMGPGDIAQAHTRDEWIDLDQVQRAVQVYLALMQARMR